MFTPRTSLEILRDPISALASQMRTALATRNAAEPVVIRMDQPSNLYLSDAQADLYLKAISDDLFLKTIYEPYLQSVRENVAALVPAHLGSVDFLDLGPGYPSNSEPLVRYLARTSSHFRYIPVDISPRFLAITSAFFRDATFEVIPLNILFEEVPLALSQLAVPSTGRFRVVNIGLTFNNFHHHDILPTLQRVAGPGGLLVLATQIATPDNIPSLLAPYSSTKADDFNFRMLQLVGFPRADFEYHVRYASSRIQMGFTVARQSTVQDVGTLRVGDVVETSFSYRYSDSELTACLRQYFSHITIFTDASTRFCIASMQEGK